MLQGITKKLISWRSLLKRHSLSDLSLPEIVEIEPTNACNLKCFMCHYPYLDESKQFLDMRLLAKLRSLRGKWVAICGGFEPMLHPQFIELYEHLCSLDCHLDLTTNGTLLTPSICDRLTNRCLRNVTFSFDSVDATTYEQIRRGASFVRTLEGILGFRELLKQSDTFLAVNMTVMKINFEGIGLASAFWNDQGFDQIRFPFMVVRNLTPLLLEQSLYPIRSQAFRELDDAAFGCIRDGMRITLYSPYFRRSPLRAKYPKNFGNGIVRSDNPGSREYFNPRHYFQNVHYPGMLIKCASPFTFAKILPNGQVVLCNRFTVGNLHDMDFQDIWFGQRAQEVRQRIIRDASICEDCDYYRFCLRSTKIDLDDLENYFAVELLSKSGGVVDLESAEEFLYAAPIGTIPPVKLD